MAWSLSFICNLAASTSVSRTVSNGIITRFCGTYATLGCVLVLARTLPVVGGTWSKTMSPSPMAENDPNLVRLAGCCSMCQVTWPLVGTRSPTKQSRKVVLPQPERPMTAVTDPGTAEKQT